MNLRIRPDCISMPTAPVPRTYVPPGATSYRVKDNDSWVTLAKGAGMSPWELIRFNYPSLPADEHRAAREVNWYLQEYVGCRQVTTDFKNYCFSNAASPGMVYLPAEPGYCAGSTAPVLTNIADRRKSILANTPGLFKVADNPAATAYPAPWYSQEDCEETTLNYLTIQQMADRYHLDRDFVSAIVWMESTHGWYDRFDPHNKTIRPMNVHAALWSDLGITRKDLDDPKLNIAAGTHILAAIWERTENPTFEKVATLYNQLGATEVNGYGKTVVYYMKQKPWSHKLGESYRKYQERRQQMGN